jgi:NDP-sugar pyrophosphorylase family protein
MNIEGKTSIRRAVIPAAGRGKRMGEITNEVPKTMLNVRGRPMLEHVLNGLAEVGIESFFLVVGYHRELIQEYFRNWKLPIEFCVQEPVDGTGSAARLAREFCGDEPFLFTYGDIICDPQSYIRCGRELEEHPEAAAVLGVRDVDDPWQGAAVYEEGGRVTRVIEKPPRGTSTTRWNSAGLDGLRPVAFSYLDKLQRSPRGEYEITDIFTMMLNDNVEVRISPMEGLWRDVGRPEDLAALNNKA